LNYGGNNWDRARVDRTEDAAILAKLEREAEVYAGVDDQIRYKQTLVEADNEFERGWDERMERDREVAILKREHELAKKRLKERAEYAESYAYSMEQRRRKQLDEAAEVMADREYMLKLQAKNEEEIRNEKQAKIDRGIRNKREARKYYEMQTRKKQLDKEEAIAEDMRLAAFQQRKVEEENREIARRERKKKEAEILTAKLRQKQEKHSDTKAERDEELMIRHQRAHHLKEMRKARKLKEDKEKRNRETMEIRIRQVREKAGKMAEDAEIERKQYKRAMADQEAEKRRISNQDEERKQRDMDYRSELKQQIAQRDVAKAAQAKANIDNVRIVEETKSEALARALEESRQERLRNLKKKGIPERYAHKLANYQFKHV